MVSTGLPAARPLRLATAGELAGQFRLALARSDGLAGAHCIHELWMRGEIQANIEMALTNLWQCAASSIPDWLPMRYVEWLPRVYEVTGRFQRQTRGRSNIYLVLLDYSDSRDEPYGVYVGMSAYSAMQRFDQHKAGIRAAGSVMRRGIEVLIGPVMHLQGLARTEAARIEEGLAEALRAAGLLVQGGH